MAEKRISIDYGSISGGTDVSDTTALVEDVLEGKVFHLANGESAVGTYIPIEINPTYVSYNTLATNSSFTKTIDITKKYIVFGVCVFNDSVNRTSVNYIDNGVISFIGNDTSGDSGVHLSISGSTLTVRHSGPGVDSRVVIISI